MPVPQLIQIIDALLYFEFTFMALLRCIWYNSHHTVVLMLITMWFKYWNKLWLSKLIMLKKSNSFILDIHIIFVVRSVSVVTRSQVLMTQDQKASVTISVQEIHPEHVVVIGEIPSMKLVIDDLYVINNFHSQFIRLI